MKDYVVFYLIVFVVCFFTYLLNPFLEKKTFTLNKNVNEFFFYFLVSSKGIIAMCFKRGWIIK